MTVVPVSNAQSTTMSYRGHSVTTISSQLDLLEFQTVEMARSLGSHQTRIIADRRMRASFKGLGPLYVDKVQIWDLKIRSNFRLSKKNIFQKN